MQYRILGRTGERVSELGFGGAGAGLPNYLRRWDPSDGDSAHAVEAALVRAVDLGVNYFDTAPKYGSEPVFGQALKPHRDRLCLATKLWGTSADEVRASVADSLERLQTDYLDLIQFHGDIYTDEEVEGILKPGGVLAGMRTLQQEGLVRFIGLTAECVNANLSRLVATGEFDVLQIQYNLLFQNPYEPGKRAGVMYEAEEQRMGIVIMRPFTGGTFSKWLKCVYPGIEKRLDFARLIENLLTFVLSSPLTDVAIVGMRSAERVERNCAIVDDLDRRIDLDALYGRFLRHLPDSDEEVWTATSGRTQRDTDVDF